LTPVTPPELNWQQQVEIGGWQAPIPPQGLTQLDTTHTLNPVTKNATGGNVEQTAAITRGPDGSTTLALGFGTTQAAAVATAGTTVSTSLPRMVANYEKGWLDYDAGTPRS